MSENTAKRVFEPVALVVWLLVIFAYTAAIVNRSSFSVLGTVTQHHFHIEATLLSVFLVAQIVVYASMQIPVGVLVDKFGATRVICSGLFLMSCGGLMLANAEHVWTGFLARMLVGVGDACLFVSMLRMVANWFSPRILPTISQVSALTGQAGQIISVLPFAALVRQSGWNTGFTVLAVVTFLVMLVCLLWMRDGAFEPTILRKIFGKTMPSEARDSVLSRAQDLSWDSPVGPVAPPTSIISAVGYRRSVFDNLKFLLRRPGIRLGFWLHFGTAAGMHCFLLLWGSTFVTGGQGHSSAAASTIITVTVVSSIIGGISIGPLQIKFQRQRIKFAFGYIAVIMLLWLAVLLWQGAAPFWLLLVLAAVTGWGGPMAMFGFDIARTHVDKSQLGVATGIINTGSFVGALIMILGIGLLLDMQGAGTPDTYRLQAFNLAMSFQFIVWIVSIVMMLWEFPKAKKALLLRRDEFLRRSGQ